MYEPRNTGASRNGEGMDQATTEDIFTDLLYVALRMGHGEVQDLLADVIVKIGDQLTPEAVDRSKAYASYRVGQRPPRL